MPSIYERLKHLRYSLNREEKVQIGKEVADEYFKLPDRNRPFLYKKKSHEPDGTFDVWVYPKRFIFQIDEIIIHFCKERGIRASRRNRVSGERVASTKH